MPKMDYRDRKRWILAVATGRVNPKPHEQFGYKPPKGRKGKK